MSSAVPASSFSVSPGRRQQERLGRTGSGKHLTPEVRRAPIGPGLWPGPRRQGRRVGRPPESRPARGAVAAGAQLPGGRKGGPGPSRGASPRWRAAAWLKMGCLRPSSSLNTCKGVIVDIIVTITDRMPAWRRNGGCRHGCRGRRGAWTRPGGNAAGHWPRPARRDSRSARWRPGRGSPQRGCTRSRPPRPWTRWMPRWGAAGRGLARPGRPRRG